MNRLAPRRFTLLDAIVLIAATAVAFVPIRLFLWENWHFPEEWSVPEIWQTGLEVNVSLVPLALSLSAAVLLLGIKKPRSTIPRAFRKPGIVACTVALVYAVLSAMGYAVFLHFSYALDRAFLTIVTRRCCGFESGCSLCFWWEAPSLRSG